MYIHLKGLKLYGFHGVLPQENKVGAEYIIDLSLKTDFTLAAKTDKLEETVSYAEVFNAVKAEMAVPSKLLENLSYRISQRLLNDFPRIDEVNISIYKQNPPMGADCSRIGVEASFRR